MKPFSRKSFRFFNLIWKSKNGCHFFPTYWDFPEILGMDFFEKKKDLLKEIKDDLLSFGRQLSEIPESKFVMKKLFLI